MLNKTYKIGDSEFTTELNVLKVDGAWVPVVMYYEDLVELYTAECDMSKVNVYKARFKNITDKDKQDQSDILKPDLDSEVIARIQSQIEKNKVELDKINEEFSNDTEAQEQQRKYNRKVSYATKSLITSFEVIKPFLDIYLIGGKLDYENDGITDFVDQVISDFFLYKMQNKKG